MPIGMLTAAAKKGSIAARTSTWVALKAYHLIRKGASAENIPQIAKPSVNARNDIHKTPGLPGGSAITSTSTTGFSTAPPTKKIYLFAGYFNCRLTALAPTDKAPPSPYHRDGRATPTWRRRCGHTPLHRALRAHRSTHRRRPAGRGDPCTAWPSTRFQPRLRPQETAPASATSFHQ